MKYLLEIYLSPESYKLRKPVYRDIVDKLQDIEYWEKYYYHIFMMVETEIPDT